MKIESIRINGIKEPLGYELPYVKVSWKVTDTEAARQENVRITVAVDGGKIVFEKEGAGLSSGGERLDFEVAERTRYAVRVEVTGNNGESGTGETFFETPPGNFPMKGKWIAPRTEDEHHPVFIRRFNLPAEVQAALEADLGAYARLNITALGLYEAYINGKRVGDEYMTPYLSDYRNEVQYQTYDVGGLLVPGENTIEIYSGNGWYKGQIGFDNAKNVFGDRFCALAELYIKDESGNETLIATDESWTYRKSPVIESDNYDGEVLDLNICGAMSGRSAEDADNHEKPVELYAPRIKAVPRSSLPVKIMEELPVREIIHTPAGETVLDFGQNFTGFVEILKPLPKGAKVTLTCGEILQEGNFYHDNYRSAKAQFTVISDGRSEPVHPRFTFCGFRYVKLEGFPGEIQPGDFAGKVLYSALDTISEFESSDERLNRLFSNALWGQKSNFLDMPTDCPQRNERLGWTGDIQVFTPTACFNMDTRRFLGKFLSDLYKDEQKHEGAVAGYLPDLGDNPRGAAGWADAAAFIPMAMYEHYGDKDALKEAYPLMKDWTEHLIRDDIAHGDRKLWDFGFQFGDWLALDGITPQSFKGGTDDGFVASCYYYASVAKTAQAAGILGMSVDADRYEAHASKIKAAILNEYFSPAGRLCIDTQTAYVLALRFGIYKDVNKIKQGFKKRLKKDCYRIKGGFLGATSMLQTMAKNGMEREAAFFLFQRDFPGWFHCIDLGATTIWERWNSVLDDGTISGTGMNSLNHYAYGSVMEYVYRYLAGTCPEEAGFTRVKFAPQLTWRLNHLKYSYDSVSGKYTSEWEILPDGRVRVRFTVPFNCTALAVLPGKGGKNGKDGGEIELTAGVYENTYMPDTDFRLKFDEKTRLEELAEDERALDILKKELPMLYGMATGDDPESRNFVLGELRYMGYLGIDREALERVIGEVSGITA